MEEGCKGKAHCVPDAGRVFAGPLYMNASYAYPVNAVLLLGPTGVGKSPLGDAIAQYGLFGRKFHHLDFGSELRDAVSGDVGSRAYTSTELDFIHGVLARGLLLENEHFPLAQKIISLFLDRSGFQQRDGLVLNGIPRHAGQAQDIAKIASIHSLVVLDCTAEDVHCRIGNNVGGDRTERVDDHAALIEKKLIIYRERTAPLIEHYAKQGNRVYRLQVTDRMTPQQAYEKISALAAAHPPIALVAEPPE